MPRPPLDPLRFPFFGGKVRLKRVRNTAQGILYQNTNPQVGLPLWVRYNIPGFYWEYSIDNVTFFRLKENPYIPDNAYFINRGTTKPTVPALNDCELYVRLDSGFPKLCVLWSTGEEDVLAVGPLDPSLFSPLTITGISLWLKADSGIYTDTAFITPASSDGDVVKGWRDQSGFGRDLTETTNGPTLKLGIVNGKRVIRFDGINDQITTSVTIASLFGPQAGTIFAVYKPIIITSNNANIFDNEFVLSATGGYMGMVLKNTGPPKTAISFNFDVNQDGASKNIIEGNWYVDTWMHDTTNVYIGLNDTRDSSLISVASGATGLMTSLFRLGTSDGSPGRWGNFDLAEVIVYDNQLSEANRKLIEQYLAFSYAISLPY